MKYKIISYDDVWQTATVKVSNDNDDLESGMLLTISLTGIATTSDFETRINSGYAASNPPALTEINSELLNHVKDNLGADSMSFSNTESLSSSSIYTYNSTVTNYVPSWSVHTDSTLTNSQQTIPDEVI